MTIWLVGMMGAGKSAVGRGLAARLGVPFADVDAEIVREAGRGIPEIFESEGEPGFRRRERRVIEALAGQGGVAALGGGAIVQPGPGEGLAEVGTVVYLRATPDTLAARIGDDAARPLLAGLDLAGRRARLAALLEERRTAYERAQVVIDTDGRAVEALVEELAGRLEEAA